MTLLLSMLNVYCSVTNNVEDGDDPTMGPNNLKHSTNLQKLE